MLYKLRAHYRLRTGFPVIGNRSAVAGAGFLKGPRSRGETLQRAQAGWDNGVFRQNALPPPGRGDTSAPWTASGSQRSSAGMGRLKPSPVSRRGHTAFRTDALDKAPSPGQAGSAAPCDRLAK